MRAGAHSTLEFGDRKLVSPGRSVEVTVHKAASAPLPASRAHSKNLSEFLCPSHSRSVLDCGGWGLGGTHRFSPCHRETIPPHAGPPSCKDGNHAARGGPAHSHAGHHPNFSESIHHKSRQTRNGAGLPRDPITINHQFFCSQESGGAWPRSSTQSPITLRQLEEPWPSLEEGGPKGPPLKLPCTG